MPEKTTTPETTPETTPAPEETPETEEETTPEEETPEETTGPESVADVLEADPETGTFVGTDDDRVATETAAALMRRDAVKIANAEKTATMATKAIAARMMAFVLLILRPEKDGHPAGPDWGRESQVAKDFTSYTITAPLQAVPGKYSDADIKRVQDRLKKEIERNARPAAIARYVKGLAESGTFVAVDGSPLEGDALKIAIKARETAEYKRAGLKDPHATRPRGGSGPKGKLANPNADLTNTVSAFVNTVKPETDGGDGKRVAPAETIAAAHRLFDTVVLDYVNHGGEIPGKTDAVQFARDLVIAISVYLEAAENGSKNFDELLSTAFAEK